LIDYICTPIREMAERLNAAVLKTVDCYRSGGSNPSLSAKWSIVIDFQFIMLHFFNYVYIIVNMSAELNKFINEYVQLPVDVLNDIVSKFRSKKIKKNELVLMEGETCKDLIFVQNGCLRLYYIQEDVEISVWFALKHSSAIEIYSFISETPSNYFLQAIEETEILYLPKTELNKLYETHPKMQEMMRKFWEDVILHLLQRFTALQRDTAEQRYLDLLNKPELLQTIPQKYLASFIGVTPTSLSRIKKNIR
jgi:CRP-like cAMP-binding protein